MSRTMLSEAQINFRNIFAPDKILRSRGFDVKVLKQTEEIQLLLQDPYSKGSDDLYAKMLNNKERKNLLAQIENDKDRAIFSKQFEWLIGEIFIREFESFSQSNGVVVDNRKDLGDLDTIVTTRDLSFVYVECKSGTFDSTHIAKALARGHYIHSETVIFAYRKELPESKLLTMVNKVVYPGIGSNEMTLEKIAFRGGPVIYRARECYFIQIEDNAIDVIRAVTRTVSVEKNMPTITMDIGVEEYAKLGLMVQKVS